MLRACRHTVDYEYRSHKEPPLYTLKLTEGVEKRKFTAGESACWQKSHKLYQTGTPIRSTSVAFLSVRRRTDGSISPSREAAP